MFIILALLPPILAKSEAETYVDTEDNPAVQEENCDAEEVDDDIEVDDGGIEVDDD